mgnify:CR=1 FL=1
MASVEPAQSFVFDALLLTAIADGKLAAERRPRWAKTQVRLAEAYSRKHAFALADQAWALAIDYAETDEERQRYEHLREQAAAAGTRANEQNGSEPGIRPARSSEVWWFKSAKKRENGPPSKSANAVFAVSCYAWEKCNEAWAGIDRSVYRANAGQVATHPFSNMELCYLVETILTDQRSFHLPPNMEGAIPALRKLEILIASESQTGNFEHYFDGTWTGTRVIDDLDRRISENWNNGIPGRKM